MDALDPNPAAPAPIRVLIADDHPIVLDGLAAILGTQAGITVVGRAEGGDDAIARYDALLPDVLLLDLEMPGTDGVAVLHALRGRHGDALRALVFTAYQDDARLMAALRAGARGYLLKGAPRAELFAAIRTLAAGGAALPPALAERVLDRVAGDAGGDGTIPTESLTPRETDVLELLAQGRTNREIGAALTIAERTVKFHVSQILAKLDVGNRTEAVSKAARLGIVSLTGPDREG